MLAIDCGNTRIKWARFEAGRGLARGDASLGRGDAWRALGEALVDGVERVLVANVAGKDAAERIEAEVSARLGIMPEFVSVMPRGFGIECAYRDPATFGVDRWLAMIAGRHRISGPFAVVGAGTAVTFDAVDGGGRHLGGLILPGDRLMIEALAAGTQQIGVVARATAPVRGLALLGRSTGEAVGRGSLLALAAASDRAMAVVAGALGVEPVLLVTGGDAGTLAAWLESKAEIRADLVLEGLAAIADAEGSQGA
jgi:type III pantothenate kinase